MLSHTLPALKPSDPPYLIHVDGEALKACRETGKRSSVVRVVVTRSFGQTPYHCDDIEINGPSWMKTMWDKPLPDRPSAICVVQTRAEVVLTWR